MQRDYVASTSIRRHFGTKCPLGLKYLTPSDTKKKEEKLKFLSASVSNLVNTRVVLFCADIIQWILTFCDILNGSVDCIKAYVEDFSIGYVIVGRIVCTFIVGYCRCKVVFYVHFFGTKLIKT